jgi:hypothetical protein
MRVRVDETGAQHHALCVDVLAARRCTRCAELGNAAIFDHDIGLEARAARAVDQLRAAENDAAGVAM